VLRIFPRMHSNVILEFCYVYCEYPPVYNSDVAVAILKVFVLLVSVCWIRTCILHTAGF